MTTSTRRTGVRAVALVAYVFAVTMAGTTLPSPLYPLYQERLGFGTGTTTVIYAVYAGGVLVALLLFGRASDVAGRRVVLLAALAASVAAGVLFLTGDGLGVLLVARVLSGLSAGLVTVAATATMIDRAGPDLQRRATLAASATSMIGLGLGPLLAGTVAELFPAPLRTPYAVQLALLVPAAIVVLRLPDDAPHDSDRSMRDALAPQRPRVPPPTRPVFVPAAVAAFAAFSVFGLLTAVEPGILRTVLHAPNHALAGVIAFAMFAGSALGQTVTSSWEFRRSLRTGCLVLVAGLALVAGGLALPSLALLVAGTVVTGLGHGAAFRAGMTAVTVHSPESRRGETIAAFMVVAYVAISIPVVIVGALSGFISLTSAAEALSAVAALLAIGSAVVVHTRG